MRLGRVYYKVQWDDQTGEIEMEEWILRTIRGRYGYLVLKASFTWGKRSKKHGDFGFLDSIPPWCRRRFCIGVGIPKDYALSKSAAYRKAAADVRSTEDKYFEGDVKSALISKLTKRMNAEVKRNARS